MSDESTALAMRVERGGAQPHFPGLASLAVDLGKAVADERGFFLGVSQALAPGDQSKARKVVGEHDGDLRIRVRRLFGELTQSRHRALPGRGAEPRVASDRALRAHAGVNPARNPQECERIR